MAKTSYDVPAVRKAIRLIEVLCDSEVPLGVAEISQRLNLNTNMVFRLLKTLSAEGWVVQKEEGPKYIMGLKPFRHTIKPVRRMDLMVAAVEPLKELRGQTGESTYLGVPDRDRILFLEHLDGTRDIRITANPGRRSLMHCSAPGKVLLAHDTGQLVDQLLEETLKQQTRRTLCTGPKLREELQKVLAQGYAVDNEEYADGLICFAVPIFNYEAQVIGAIGVSVLTLYYTLDQLIADLGPKVIATGKKISRAMGYEQG